MLPIPWFVILLFPRTSSFTATIFSPALLLYACHHGTTSQQRSHHFWKMALKVAFFPLSALQKLEHFESFLNNFLFLPNFEAKFVAGTPFFTLTIFSVYQNRRWNRAHLYLTQQYLAICSSLITSRKWLADTVSTPNGRSYKMAESTVKTQLYLLAMSEWIT